MLMYAYAGTILYVNLSTKEIRTDSFDEQFARLFLGGNGFSAKLIYDTVPANTHPLAEENAVVFALGPLNGTTLWGAGRGHVASFSPLTGYFADSNFGGNFASVFKKAGFDAVVISGKSPEPVYIMIDDNTVALKDATELWGGSTEETHTLLVEKEGKGIESASIGPAGEQEVLFANIICSGVRVSAAGRGGLGAVLGSKQCKALVVRGTHETTIADQEQLTAYQKSYFPVLRDNAKALTALGTPVLVNMINKLGRLATRNNSRETFELAHDISGEVIEEQYKQKNVACLRCPVACGKLVYVPSGAFADESVKMPEYETIYAFGSMLENNDIVSIFNANTMCDRMGLDTITMGVTLSFVAECLEKGMVSSEELGDTVTFGPNEHLAELVELTAHKQGIGEWLALGSEQLADRFGGNARDLLYSVQGMEIAGHSARGIRSMGLAYATSTRGGSHHDARPDYRETDDDPGLKAHASYCVKSQNYTAIIDSLVLCRFIAERSLGTQVSEPLKDVLKYVTGWELSLEEIEAAGERIYTLERLMNTRRGVDRSQDRLPYKVMNEPIPDGPVKGRYCPENNLQTMLDEYYRLRGWDENGIPTRETLSRLQIA
ncbi:aldehyde ferredoxin oxidoreductase [candidate division KSB3 bacterium]|uniref:Aldehyde ferredoxin oxidoreductase n=1 Tax=candidate division KSB3 bacterium TaxID=2044937 RepID=A0A2G6KDG5_9BACT|nr:MAG: aldehyde ferredoxin oxidoreductase [candidate division KSB3 bacterium]